MGDQLVLQVAVVTLVLLVLSVPLDRWENLVILDLLDAPVNLDLMELQVCVEWMVLPVQWDLEDLLGLMEHQALLAVLAVSFMSIRLINTQELIEWIWISKSKKKNLKSRILENGKKTGDVEK